MSLSGSKRNVVAVTTLVGDQTVDAGPKRICLEVERVAAVVEGVEQDHDRVVGLENAAAESTATSTAVALHLFGDDPRRLGVQGANSDVEGVFGVDDLNERSLGGRVSLERLALDEARAPLGLLPGGFVENPVELDGACRQHCPQGRGRSHGNARDLPGLGLGFTALLRGGVEGQSEGGEQNEG